MEYGLKQIADEWRTDSEWYVDNIYTPRDSYYADKTFAEFLRRLFGLSTEADTKKYWNSGLRPEYTTRIGRLRTASMIRALWIGYSESVYYGVEVSLK